MPLALDRRDLLKLAGLGGIGLAFGSTLSGPAAAARRAADDFFFVQISDLHWGFKGDSVNPDARGTLPKVVAGVNGLSRTPDFIVVTGDLTHLTDDAKERRQRMAEVRDMLGQLRVKDLRILPGEHDAAKDRGEAYQEFFGPMHYTFDHKGVHFIALDNVSDPDQKIGQGQLDWLAADLAQLDKETPIVVLTHRPLFELFKEWDWFTADGDKALALLQPFANVSVFYGHIHQEHHFTTGRIAHHAAQSLMIPLPAPGSQPKRVPFNWDASAPYRGMGWREIAARGTEPRYELAEKAVTAA